MFIPLLKADAAQRLVYGRIDETPDHAGEIFDYASSKPMFEKWSEGVRAASGGKSLGNIRAMHGRTAAGRLEKIGYDDEARAIELCAKIVDDAEWEKIEAGVYTGFSPGGRYLKRWADGDHTRYTAEPVEISVVDLPCIPSATFSLVKADGLTEQVPFQQPDRDALIKALMDATGPAAWRQALMAAPLFVIDDLRIAGERIDDKTGLAKRLWSAASRREAAKSGHALPDGSFPIDDKADLKDAVQAFGRAKDPEKVKAHIIARAKALDATDELPADWEGSTAKEDAKSGLKKGLATVGNLAGLLEALTNLAQGVAAEAAGEGDGSTLPQRLCAWLAQGADILTSMATEEGNEALGALRQAVSVLPSFDAAQTIAGPDGMALGLGLEKRGARNSKADQDRLQAIHDHAVGMGAECADAPADKSRGLGNLIKATADLAETRERLAKAESRVAELEAEPAAPKGALKALGKGDDVENGADAEALAKIEKLPEAERATALIKLSQRRPLKF